MIFIIFIWHDNIEILHHSNSSLNFSVQFSCSYTLEISSPNAEAFVEFPCCMRQTITMPQAHTSCQIHLTICSYVCWHFALPFCLWKLPKQKENKKKKKKWKEESRNLHIFCANNCLARSRQQSRKIAEAEQRAKGEVQDIRHEIQFLFGFSTLWPKKLHPPKGIWCN